MTSSVEFEKGFKRIEGSIPPTIESLNDVVLEIIEGGFIEETTLSIHFEVVEKMN